MASNLAAKAKRRAEHSKPRRFLVNITALIAADGKTKDYPIRFIAIKRGNTPAMEETWSSNIWTWHEFYYSNVLTNPNQDNAKIICTPKC
jgi:hypothetical protein